MEANIKNAIRDVILEHSADDDEMLFNLICALKVITEELEFYKNNITIEKE